MPDLSGGYSVPQYSQPQPQPQPQPPYGQAPIPQQPAYAEPGPYPGLPPSPPPGTARPDNVFALSGVLASFIPFVGLVFSLIGLSKAKVLGVGKGLATAGLVLSLVFTASWGVAGYYGFKAVNSTAADPGCISADADYLHDDGPMVHDAETMINAMSSGLSSPAFTQAVKKYQADLTTLVASLNGDAARSVHDDVKSAIQSLTNDLSQLDTDLDAMAAGNVSGAGSMMNLTSKESVDFQKLESLCTSMSTG